MSFYGDMAARGRDTIPCEERSRGPEGTASLSERPRRLAADGLSVCWMSAVIMAMKGERVPFLP